LQDSILKGRDFSGEFNFSASHSSGPGGQNINKVSTKIELRFDVISSFLLTEEEKKLISNKLKKRINKEGILKITSQSERSQLKNKEQAVDKFYEIIEKALTPRKPRKPTRPTAASKKKRIEIKRKLSEKKERRKVNELE
jgi:ribosome-associated protein